MNNDIKEYKLPDFPRFFKWVNHQRLPVLVGGAVILGLIATEPIMRKDSNKSLISEANVQQVKSKTPLDSLVLNLGQEEFMFSIGAYHLTPRAKDNLDKYSFILKNSYHTAFDIPTPIDIGMSSDEYHNELAMVGILGRAGRISNDLIITSDEINRAYNDLSKETLDSLRVKLFDEYGRPKKH